MKFFIWIPAVFGVTLAVLAADLPFTVRKYQPSAAEKALEIALDTASTFGIQSSIARDYQNRYPEDVAVQLRAASALMMENADAVREFYRDRAEREPQSEIAVYLAGRLMSDPRDQQNYARKMLSRDPDSYWGNLLLSGTYPVDSDSGFRAAKDLLLKAIRKDNSLPYAVERLGNILRAHGDNTDADGVFRKLSEMQPDRFEPIQYRVMLAAPDQQKAIRILDEFLERNPRHVDALYTKARAQREVNDWPGHIQTMRRVFDAKPVGTSAYDLACGFSLSGATDSAYAWLFIAVDSGFTDIEQYKADEDLIPLRDDPRWNDLLVRVETGEKARMAEFMRQMAATAPQRKKEAVSERQDKTAPDWTAKDLDGETVSLADLKGKVVIIDFWATWCGPCRKTMPLLDKFYTESKPENVVVYGMNVWERDPNRDKVRPYIAEKGYRFPILLGANETAEAYGVTGIPTLFVIDQQGRIAYRHIGYNPTIAEVLTWQVNELLKK